MKLRTAFSPCPNDTFIFHAMVNSLIDCEGLSFEVTMADVEELNRGAYQGLFDICKLSYHAFFKLAERYWMLESGSALGWGNGPLLVAAANSPIFDSTERVNLNRLAEEKILIPGRDTTAALLLSLYFPEAKNTQEMLFSKIEEALLKGEAAAGVIIHESRFKYREKGLVKIADLGEEWERANRLPLPLGGIAFSKKFDSDTAKRVERVLKRSVQYAIANPKDSFDFVMESAQEIEESVVEKHIEMFVNSYSVELGNEGKRGVERLYNLMLESSFPLEKIDNLFIK
ncbi:MAG: 1,4-dihydroxy-6-naphthoate synthase [Bacteroidales bacterium]